MGEISIIALVIGLTQWVKERVGLSGVAAEVAALVIGLVIGAGSKLSQGVPTDFAGWFGIAVYGLAMGLVPSGLYKFASDFKSNKGQA